MVAYNILYINFPENTHEIMIMGSLIINGLGVAKYGGYDERNRTTREGGGRKILDASRRGGGFFVSPEGGVEKF